MLRHLYLVRHGETLFNCKHLIQGWCDSPLSEQGTRQAQLVGAYFTHRGISFDHAYAAPLGRTRATIEEMYDGVYETDARLREMYFGMYEGEHSYVMPPMPWEGFFVQFGGESLQEAQDRMVAALTDIMRRPGHECVLAVSSGTTCRLFLKYCEETSTIRFDEIPGNCSIMRLEFDGDTFDLVELLQQPDIQALLA